VSTANHNLRLLRNAIIVLTVICAILIGIGVAAFILLQFQTNISTTTLSLIALLFLKSTITAYVGHSGGSG
jgi:hypothetical protein